MNQGLFTHVIVLPAATVMVVVELRSWFRHHAIIAAREYAHSSRCLFPCGGQAAGLEILGSRNLCSARARRSGRDRDAGSNYHVSCAGKCEAHGILHSSVRKTKLFVSWFAVAHEDILLCRPGLVYVKEESTQGPLVTSLLDFAPHFYSGANWLVVTTDKNIVVKKLQARTTPVLFP